MPETLKTVELDLSDPAGAGRTIMDAAALPILRDFERQLDDPEAVAILYAAAIGAFLGTVTAAMGIDAAEQLYRDLAGCFDEARKISAGAAGAIMPAPSSLN